MGDECPRRLCACAFFSCVGRPVACARKSKNDAPPSFCNRRKKPYANYCDIHRLTRSSVKKQDHRTSSISRRSCSPRFSPPFTSYRPASPRVPGTAIPPRTYCARRAPSVSPARPTSPAYPFGGCANTSLSDAGDTNARCTLRRHLTRPATDGRTSRGSYF